MDAIVTNSQTVPPTKRDPVAACTLPPPALRERLAWIRDEILPHAWRSERLASGRAWEFDAAAGLAEKLDQLVALERECCGGIVFERMNGSRPGSLRLEVRGIDPDSALLRALDSRPETGGTRSARLARAGGLGILAALTVCCAVPIGASLLFGAAATAGLAGLDEPWVIGLGALSASAGAWWWLGRSNAKKVRGDATKQECGPTCG